MFAYFNQKLLRNKRLLVVLLVFSMVFFASSVGLALKNSGKSTIKQVEGIVEEKPFSYDQFASYTSQRYVSRAIMSYAQDIVAQESPTPPQTARLYAYISSTFYDVYMVKKDTNSALYATKAVLDTLYPKHIDQTQNVVQALTHNHMPPNLEGEEKQTLARVLEWISTDGSSLLYTGKTDSKAGWEEVSADLLGSPMAGGWKRWIVDEKSDFQVPAPEPNTYSEVTLSKKITKELSISQRNIAVFWTNSKEKGGLAGIWQNRLYDEVESSKTTEEEYAKVQKNLAMGIADATLEAWKVKYQYWTPRLDNPNEEIKQITKAPFYPSYVSEAATIGATASTILGSYLSHKQDIFEQDARDARDSGLWAGVQLDRDNQAGYELGKKIGNEVINRLK
jgi:hypothetical protein